MVLSSGDDLLLPKFPKVSIAVDRILDCRNADCSIVRFGGNQVFDRPGKIFMDPHGAINGSIECPVTADDRDDPAAFGMV
jgi:hypothetical protein